MMNATLRGVQEPLSLRTRPNQNPSAVSQHVLAAVESLANPFLLAI